MSVEINIGDIIEFNNITCHMLIHKMYGEPEFTLTPNLVGNTEATVIFIHRLDDLMDSGYLIAKGLHYTFLINLPDLFASKTALINGIKIYSSDDYPNK